MSEQPSNDRASLTRHERAQVFAIAHVGTVMNAISHGLGRTLDGALPSDLSQAANVSAPCYSTYPDGSSPAKKKMR